MSIPLLLDTIVNGVPTRRRLLKPASRRKSIFEREPDSVRPVLLRHYRSCLAVISIASCPIVQEEEQLCGLSTANECVLIVVQFVSPFFLGILVGSRGPSGQSRSTASQNPPNW